MTSLFRQGVETVCNGKERETRRQGPRPQKEVQVGLGAGVRTWGAGQCQVLTAGSPAATFLFMPPNPLLPPRRLTTLAGLRSRLDFSEGDLPS